VVRQKDLKLQKPERFWLQNLVTTTYLQTRVRQTKKALIEKNYQKLIAKWLKIYFLINNIKNG
jgi:hypothetical protein